MSAGSAANSVCPDITLSLRCSLSTASSAILASVIASAAIFAVVTFKSVIAAVFTDPAPGAFVAVALPKNSHYISSVPFVNAADSVRVVPDAVYALPDPGS